MKYFILLFFIANSCLLAGQDLISAADSIAPYQEASFVYRQIELGEVKKGETVDTLFSFSNTGNTPLKIELVSACECTTLDWTRKSILPGEEGIIEIHFDSSEKDDSEPVDVDIYFKEIEGIDPLFEILNFSFQLIK